jgi:hypothetical protein
MINSSTTSKSINRYSVIRVLQKRLLLKSISQSLVGVVSMALFFYNNPEEHLFTPFAFYKKMTQEPNSIYVHSFKWF